MLLWWPWKRSSWRRKHGLTGGVCAMQLRLPWKSNLYHHAAEMILHIIWSVIFKVSRLWHAIDGPLCMMRVNCPAARFGLSEQSLSVSSRVFVSIMLTLDDLTLFHSIWLCLACAPVYRIMFNCSGYPCNNQERGGLFTCLHCLSCCWIWWWGNLMDFLMQNCHGDI